MNNDYAKSVLTKPPPNFLEITWHHLKNLAEIWLVQALSQILFTTEIWVPK